MCVAIVKKSYWPKELGILACELAIAFCSARQQERDGVLE